MTFKYFRMKHHTKGFTLLEILIASVILFSTITTVTLIYKGAFVASKKASEHMHVNELIPIILSKIRYEIRSQGNNDSLELVGENSAWGVSYHWKATLEDFRSPPEYFDIDSGKFTTNVEKYKLWEIELALKYGNSQIHHNYKELSWNDK